MKNKIAVKLAALAMFAAVSANAATWYWTGAGGDLNWFTPANWNSAADGTGDAATELSSGDSFTFGDAVADSLEIAYNPPAADFSIGSIAFSSGCGAVTVTGDAIASIGSMSNATTNKTVQTFANDVQFSSTINMTGPTAWDDAYITFKSKNGATGTEPANYSLFRGKQTFTASSWILSSRHYRVYGDVRFCGDVTENASNSYRFSVVGVGCRLVIDGSLSAGRSSGSSIVFGTVNGTVIVKEMITASHNVVGCGNTIVQNMGDEGVIVCKGTDIRLGNSGRRVTITNFKRLGMLPGWSPNQNITTAGWYDWPEVFEIGAATGDATFVTMRTCHIQSDDGYKPQTVLFNTIDMADRTTKRTVTMSGTFVGTGFDSSTRLKLAATGAGVFRVACDVSSLAEGGARFAGGFTASDGVTVELAGEGCRPSTGPFTMTGGTTLSIPSSITTGEIGGSGTVSFDADSTLAVNFSSTTAAPVLALSSGSSLSLPETGSMKVKITAADGLDFNFGTEYAITSGSKFPADAVTSGKVVLAEDSPAWAKLYVNASGDLAVKVADYFYIKIAGTEDIDLPVPMQWLDDNGIAAADDSIKSVVDALTENGANGIPVWQSYCMGLDPNDTENAVICAAAAEQPSEAGKVAIEVSRSFVPAELSGVTVKAYLDVKRPGHDWDFDETGETVSSGAISRTAEISDPGISFFA